MSLSSVGDERFYNIDNIYSFGKKLSMVFNVVTNWNSNIHLEYIDYQGEKCLGIDANDEIIPLNASLSYGVANEMFIKNYRRDIKVPSNRYITGHVIKFIRNSRVFTPYV